MCLTGESGIHPPLLSRHPERSPSVGELRSDEGSLTLHSADSLGDSRRTTSCSLILLADPSHRLSCFTSDKSAAAADLLVAALSAAKQPPLPQPPRAGSQGTVHQEVCFAVCRSANDAFALSRAYVNQREALGQFQLKVLSLCRNKMFMSCITREKLSERMNSCQRQLSDVENLSHGTWWDPKSSLRQDR